LYCVGRLFCPPLRLLFGCSIPFSSFFECHVILTACPIPYLPVSLALQTRSLALSFISAKEGWGAGPSSPDPVPLDNPFLLALKKKGQKKRGCENFFRRSQKISPCPLGTCEGGITCHCASMVRVLQMPYKDKFPSLPSDIPIIVCGDPLILLQFCNFLRIGFRQGRLPRTPSPRSSNVLMVTLP
jgi:hypothetical protein